jgi:hypothetical protein
VLSFRLVGIKRRRYDCLSKPWWCHAVLMVRIHFPPAESHTNLPVATPSRIADGSGADIAGRTETAFVVVIMNSCSPTPAKQRPKRATYCRSTRSRWTR